MNSIHSSEVLDVVVTDARATVTLNKPRTGNALGPDLVEALDAALTKAISDGARLIVFRGAGKHFCTGFDLGDIDSCSDGDLLLRFVKIEQWLQKVHRCPVTTVAVATGRVIGAGADLFAACDRRIGLPGATFAFPGSGFGLVLGTRRLAARIGDGPARRCLLDGKAIPLERAVELGLATDLCAEADLAAILEDAQRSAIRLSSKTVAALHSVTISRDDAADLAALVDSASEPGLKLRIMDHIRRVAAERGSGRATEFA